MTLNGFLDSVGKSTGSATYHGQAASADEPPARYTIPAAMKSRVVDGVEVSEHDIVRGEMQLVYACHCPCGKRWFDPAPEQLQVCRKCGRPVLLELR